MKRFFTYLMLMCPFGLFAQGEMDALKMGETDILGTARYMSMGGAFGALGGDASSIGVNPAGLGIYRKSEISFTPSVMVNRNESETPGATTDDHRSTFNVNNFSTVFNFKGGGDVMKYSSFAFSYNRRTNFRRNMNAFYKDSPASISDYMTLRTNELGIRRADIGNKDYIFSGDIPYISDLAWQACMIDPIEDSDDCKQYKSFLNPGELTTANVWSKEKGGVNQFDFAYGGNIKDIVFFGASLGIYNINYRMESYYGEVYESGGYFRLKNTLRTYGCGVDFKFGTIVAPVDFLRLGFSFHTPTWFFLNDEAKFSADYDTGENRTGHIGTIRSAAEYDYRSPYSLVGSLAFVIGQKAIISADYEMSDYAKMEFDTPDDDRDYYHSSPDLYWKENELISKDFKKKHTLRVGAEYRVTKDWSIRLGYAYSTSPVKDALENDLDDSGKRANVIYTAGTTPAYSIPQDNMTYSGGFGYHKSFFFVDFAYALNLQKENYYMFFDKSNLMSPVKLTSKRHFAVCTLGFKF